MTTLAESPCVGKSFIPTMIGGLLLSHAVLSEPQSITKTGLESKNMHTEHSEEIDEVIVTGIRPIEKENYPRSVSVLDEQALFLLGARDLPRALSYLPNVSFVSFAGTGKRARIDIRGSGDTSVSNIVVLEDGQRVGVRDLSGTDFSTLPLNLVKRVEVVRGGNSVRYGSGASHGVINIITKMADGSNSWSVDHEMGSFDHSLSSAHLNVSEQQHGLFLFLQQSDSDGYREHNRLRADSGQISYRYQTENDSQLNLRYSSNSDDYELPGPLSLSEVRQGIIDPRDAFSGNLLLGSSDQEKYSATVQIQLGSTVSLELLGSRLKKTDDTGQRPLLGFAPRPGRINNQIEIASALLTADVGHLTYLMGYDFEKQNNVRIDRLTPAVAPLPINTAETWVNAGFGYLSLEINEGTNIGLGYRRDITKANHFRQTLVNETKTDISRPDWKNEAVELDLRFNRGSSNVFLNASKTFRNPNADELALDNLMQAQVSALLLVGPLQPQTAERYELGFQYKKSQLELGAYLFRSLTSKEIIFRTNSAGTNVNGNLANTAKRQGAEFALDYFSGNHWRIGTSLGMLSSRLGSRTNSSSGHQQRIPLVPKLNAAINIDWKPNDIFTASLNGQYIASRLDGNDFNGNDPDNRLPSVVLSSASAKYKIPISDKTMMELALSIDNIGNQQYATASYSGQGYPQPSRSFNISIRFGS